jgi:hypothetical protein
LAIKESKISVTSFGKSSGEDVISLGTQAWNIADGFTKIKILRILIEIDLHETIAMFGKKDMEEQTPYAEIPYRRVEAFERMLFSLKQLIGNCRFSIEKGVDEKTIAGLINRIDQVEEVADGIASEFINDVTKEDELRINEVHFRNCFNILRAVKDELNFPINRAGLIFRRTDEIDLDKIMADIEQGG